MKFLITGGSGFIANYLVKELKSEGHTIKTLGRGIENDYCINLSKEFKFIDEYFDIIIHTAAIVHDSNHVESFNAKKILEDFRISQNLIACLSNLEKTKLIYLSSVAVYGLSNGRNVDIDTPKHPKNGYGLSKLLNEQLFLSSVAKENLLILRLPLVNGPVPKGNIAKAIQLIESNKMFLFTNNNAKKSILEIKDLYKIISQFGNKTSGIHQIKSYDIAFNEFLQSLTNKKLRLIPFISPKFLIFILSILKLENLKHSMIKITSNLTFKATIKIYE